jgi:hypothetical protein
MDLHVVTPCARPGNLPRIAESIRAAALPESMALHWLVVLDDRFDLGEVSVEGATVVTSPGTTGVAGHAQRNDALERIGSGWIVFVDDDNLLHPSLPSVLDRTLRANPNARFVVFDQDLGDGIRRARPENVRVSGIDSAQFAFERAFAGDERFDVYAYSADGIFAARLFQRSPRSFAFVPETAAFYNALNRGHFGEPPPGRRTAGALPRAHNAGSLHFHRTFATDDKIRLGSNVHGHRLYLSDGAILRAPLNPGRQRLTGRAWGSGHLQIAAGDRIVVDKRLHPIVRLIGGRPFEAELEGAEIEIQVRGGRVVIDSLSCGATP